MSELTMQIYLGQGTPDVEFKNSTDFVSLAKFANSPLFAELSPEQATVWAAQLRVLACQCDEWAAMAGAQVCFPSSGTEGA